MPSECLAVKPVSKEPGASAAVVINSPTDDSGFAWSLSATDVPGLSRDCFYSDSGGTLHICTHTDWFTDLSPKVVKLLVQVMLQLTLKILEPSSTEMELS